MDRSQVNEIIGQSAAFIEGLGFILPPFAVWGLDQWRKNHPHIKGIIESKLGWDITDYAKGNFADLGLVLFTLRNGKLKTLAQGRGMVYAEKIMISRHEQISPMHHHKLKTEDIINRGGARLAIKVYRVARDGGLERDTPVQVLSDAMAKHIPAGGTFILNPGESVTITPDVYHEFWGEDGDVLVGEVSTVNDDLNDNFFVEKLGRFPQITENEQPHRLLVSDYDRYLS